MDWKNKPQKIFNKVKQQMFSKGVQSFYALDSHIETFDPNHVGHLSVHFFNLFLNRVGVFLSTQQIRSVHDVYPQGDEIAYFSFLQDVKYSMSEYIATLIEEAFSRLGGTADHSLDLNTIIPFYNATQHPHVLTRKKSPEIVTQEFIQALTRKITQQKVSKEIFIDYYAELNFCIPEEREDFFQALIRGVWGLNPSSKFVPDKKISQIQHILYEKIRQKANGKIGEWKTAKKALAFFDLEDRKACSYEQFKRGLDKFGCTFKEHEMQALFSKYDVNRNGILQYEEFSKMIMDIDISGMAKQPNLLTTLGTNHFKVTH